MTARPVGATALLVEVADAATALDLAAWARRSLGSLGLVEVVPAATTVLLDGVDPDLARQQIAAWSPGERAAVAVEVVLPVVYDGPDLDDVAARWGTDRAGVVERHTAASYRVDFCGFAPGFAYLSGLPGELSVPRLDSPRTRVPAGSVGLAGDRCGVYPSPSPGGWRLLGRTDAVLWDVDRDPPALLAPGTRVRFAPR